MNDNDMNDNEMNGNDMNGNEMNGANERGEIDGVLTESLRRRGASAQIGGATMTDVHRRVMRRRRRMTGAALAAVVVPVVAVVAVLNTRHDSPRVASAAVPPTAGPASTAPAKPGTAAAGAPIVACNGPAIITTNGSATDPLVLPDGIKPGTYVIGANGKFTPVPEDSIPAGANVVTVLSDGRVTVEASATGGAPAPAGSTDTVVGGATPPPGNATAIATAVGGSAGGGVISCGGPLGAMTGPGPWRCQGQPTPEPDGWTVYPYCEPVCVASLGVGEPAVSVLEPSTSVSGAPSTTVNSNAVTSTTVEPNVAATSTTVDPNPATSTTVAPSTGGTSTTVIDYPVVPSSLPPAVVTGTTCAVSIAPAPGVEPTTTAP